MSFKDAIARLLRTVDSQGRRGVDIGIVPANVAAFMAGASGGVITLWAGGGPTFAVLTMDANGQFTIGRDDETFPTYVPSLVMNTDGTWTFLSDMFSFQKIQLLGTDGFEGPYAAIAGTVTATDVTATGVMSAQDVNAAGDITVGDDLSVNDLTTSGRLAIINDISAPTMQLQDSHNAVTWTAVAGDINTYDYRAGFPFITFVAPPSGAVEIQAYGFVKSATAAVAALATFGVRVGNNPAAGAIFFAPGSIQAFGNYNINYCKGTGANTLVTGLTPGTTYTAYVAAFSGAVGGIVTSPGITLKNSM